MREIQMPFEQSPHCSNVTRMPKPGFKVTLHSKG